MVNITAKYGRSLIAVVAIASAAACSKKPASQQTAGGAVDTAVLRTGSSAVTPAVGPAVQVTRTDAKSVTKSLDYQLTSDNFAKFVAAADSISVLEARDSTTRNYLSKNI